MGQKFADRTNALMVDHFRIDSNREGHTLDPPGIVSQNQGGNCKLQTE